MKKVGDRTEVRLLPPRRSSSTPGDPRQDETPDKGRRGGVGDHLSQVRGGGGGDRTYGSPSHLSFISDRPPRVLPPVPLRFDFYFRPLPRRLARTLVQTYCSTRPRPNDKKVCPEREETESRPRGQRKEEKKEDR